MNTKLNKSAQECTDKITLLNWCLKNYAQGAGIVSRWDVNKNALEGVYITDIPYDYDKEVWVRESMSCMDSKKMLLSDLFTG